MRSSAATRSVPLRLAAVVIVAGFLAAACDLHGAPRARSATSPATTRSPPGASPPAAPAPWNDPATVAGPGLLAPGSDPAVLPAAVMIADNKNNRLVIVDPQGRVRWQFPQPGDLAPGQTFLVPDDAFFSPDGREIIATQEDDFVISVVDVATRRIVYRYGTPGQPGTGLWSTHPPDVAYPSDSNEIGPGRYLTVDYSTPGQVVIFDQAGRTLWRYQPTGAAALRNPSLALPLPGGDVIL